MGLSAATLTGLAQLSGGVPKGYLRVLSFNEDSVLVDQRTVQLSAAALGNYEPLQTGPLVVQQNGYVSVYVGNESPADVYFDDVTIEHRQGLQVQENQYDPFGLDLAGVSGAAPGLRLKNFYQFNGKENQLDLGLNWNHQDWRFFDYQIGRWHVVDPEIENAQESWTPYSFGFDNAIRYADADGRAPGNGEGAPSGGIYVANMITGTFYGLCASVANTALSMRDYSSPASMVNMMSGSSVRAVGDANGIHFEQRAPITSNQQLASNVGSDLLDIGQTVLTGATLGSGGLASSALPRGAGMLLVVEKP